MITKARTSQSFNWQTQTNRWLKEWKRWNTNFTTRKDLLELDESQLQDIGIDVVTAIREGNKPFWRR